MTGDAVVAIVALLAFAVVVWGSLGNERPGLRAILRGVGPWAAGTAGYAVLRGDFDPKAAFGIGLGVGVLVMLLAEWLRRKGARPRGS